MGTAASGALTGTQQLPNYAQQNYPQFQSATNNITSGAYGASQIQGAGNTAISSGNSLVPYATQALQTGFDPQNAQYNAQFGQQQQQTGANAAANGVAGTPYGAGVTNAADNEFNLAWQQQELQRQQTGASTANSLLNQQNQGAVTGQGLLTGVADQNLSALSALNNAGGQATGVDQQMIQDFLAYLSGGTSATNAATSQYSAEASAALGQQGLTDQGLAGLGSLGSSLFSMIPGLGTAGGGSMAGLALV